MTNVVWLDFNDALDQELATKPRLESSEVKAQLLARLPSVLHYLFPAGKQRSKQYVVGDLDGNAGKSLVIELDGARAGMWIDFATGEGGDILDAWARVMHLDARNDFPAVMSSVAQWLGVPDQIPLKGSTNSPLPSHNKSVPVDELGPATAKWDYRDPHGKLIACVYRYDTPNGKEFRPWDVLARSRRAPDPRPLYNQPQIASASHIILVEGEKAADALIREGLVATTAMNGAHAPVGKTDWSPLKGKQVLIWPDNDEAGQQYASRAAQAIAQAGASTVAVLHLPDEKPEKWDAADAVAEGIDVWSFVRDSQRTILKDAPIIPVHSLGELLADTSPMPDDLIAPRVLTPGGMVVFGGAPKVGKSALLISLLVHKASGLRFLGFTRPRPLRIFSLQA